MLNTSTYLRQRGLALPKDTFLKLLNIQTGDFLKRKMPETDYLRSTNPVLEIYFIMITLSH